jgi:hypothetical protein
MENEEDINDVSNLRGITNIMNTNGLNMDELEDIENQILNESDDDYNHNMDSEDDINDFKNGLGDIDKIIMDDEYSNNEEYSNDEDDYMTFDTSEHKPYENDSKEVISNLLDREDDYDNHNNNTMFNMESEKEEDTKSLLLDQIDILLTTLEDEGEDVSRVPSVTNHSSLDDIQSVHRILRLKNDRQRYCSFAEECILAGSHTLEWLFDGKKEYLGRRPDLRGWSATVNIKLRRMRYDTSTVVSDIMKDYNLSHGTRIALELIPSLLLYSKMKKNQHNDNLITSDEMNNAINNIRDIEENV